MIGSTRQVAVWPYGAAADLRKGVDGLSGLVSQGLGRDPQVAVLLEREWETLHAKGAASPTSSPVSAATTSPPPSASWRS